MALTDRGTSRRGDMMRPRPRRSSSVFRPSRIGALGGISPQLLGLPQQQVPAAANIGYAQPGFSGGVGGYDINSDPAVAAAHSLAEKIRAQAQASALAKMQQATIEFGSAEGVLDPTTGKPIDEKTSKAASDNPFSVLKNLEHTYSTGKQDLEEGLNKANLFYSGYRGQQLGEAARAYQENKYNASNAFRGLSTDILDALANARLQADMYEQSAISGSSGGGYDYGSDGGETPPPQHPDSGSVQPVMTSAQSRRRIRRNERRRAASGRPT